MRAWPLRLSLPAVIVSGQVTGCLRGSLPAARHISTLALLGPLDCAAQATTQARLPAYLPSWLTWVLPQPHLHDIVCPHFTPAGAQRISFVSDWPTGSGHAAIMRLVCEAGARVDARDIAGRAWAINGCSATACGTGQRSCSCSASIGKPDQGLRVVASAAHAAAALRDSTPAAGTTCQHCAPECCRLHRPGACHGSPPAARAGKGAAGVWCQPEPAHAVRHHLSKCDLRPLLRHLCHGKVGAIKQCWLLRLARFSPAALQVRRRAAAPRLHGSRARVRAAAA